MKVKGNHPLAEILGKKLFGIESVPPAEQRKMVARAIKAALSYQEERCRTCLESEMWPVESDTTGLSWIAPTEEEVAQGIRETIHTLTDKNNYQL